MYSSFDVYNNPKQHSGTLQTHASLPQLYNNLHA